MTWTYADVDHSPDPTGAAQWMDTFRRWPAVAAYKARTLELTGDDRPVIDVGCGLGDEVRALGRGAIGVDLSTVMLAEAAKRGGAFVKGVVHALPFANQSTASVRVDRVLQHVVDPVSALDELVRVLRPGGVLVCAEPDQATLTITGTDGELTPTIVRFRAEVGIRNGYFAGEIAGHLAARGFDVTAMEAFTVAIEQPEFALGLTSWPAQLVERGEWSEAEAQRFTESLGSDSFRYQFDIVVTAATR